MLAQKQTISTPQLSSLNLTSLPLQLQIELIDFYEFLLKKYDFNPEIETPTQNTKFKKFLANPIQIPESQTWTREELHER